VALLSVAATLVLLKREEVGTEPETAGAPVG
jgi:hypothetical protein